MKWDDALFVGLTTAGMLRVMWTLWQAHRREDEEEQVVLSIGGLAEPLEAGPDPATDDIFVFHPSSQVWTTKTTAAAATTATTGATRAAAGTTTATTTNAFKFPVPVFGARAAVLRDGNVVVAGGFSSTAVFVLQAPRTDHPSFLRVADTLIIRFAAAMVTLPSGVVMIVGGKAGFVHHDSVEFYDPVKDKWTLGVTTMESKRSACAAVVMPGGARVLIIGGIANLAYLATCEYYNIHTNTFEPIRNPMKHRRGRVAATLLATGNVLVCGGIDAAGPLSSCELFHAGSEEWEMVASMEVARAGHGCVTVQDHTVFVFGGNVFADRVDMPTAHTESLDTTNPDPSTWTWKRGPDMPQPRRQQAFIVL